MFLSTILIYICQQYKTIQAAVDMLFSSVTYDSIRQFDKEKVVVLPIGAVEQHGLHLATATDTDLVSAIAAVVEARLSDQVLLCPTLAFGASHHHLSFGGTISISVNTYTLLIQDLVVSLFQNGFKRIAILNGHGGNIIPVRQALAILSSRPEFQSVNIALATYWELAGEAFAGKLPMESPALSHACEYETSLMLHLFPQKVFSDKIKRANKAASNEYIFWEDEGPYRGVTMIKPTAMISDNGSSGEPQLASEAKGKFLFEEAVAALEKFLVSFQSWPILKYLQP